MPYFKKFSDKKQKKRILFFTYLTFETIIKSITLYTINMFERNHTLGHFIPRYTVN